MGKRKARTDIERLKQLEARTNRRLLRIEATLDKTRRREQYLYGQAIASSIEMGDTGEAWMRRILDIHIRNNWDRAFLGLLPFRAPSSLPLHEPWHRRITVRAPRFLSAIFAGHGIYALYRYGVQASVVSH